MLPHILLLLLDPVQLDPLLLPPHSSPQLPCVRVIVCQPPVQIAEVSQERNIG